MKKIQGSLKKRQEFVKNFKNYVWIVPKHLENEIEIGDEILVNSTYYFEPTVGCIYNKHKVSVVNIYQNDLIEDPGMERRVLKIIKKNRKNKKIKKVKK